MISSSTSVHQQQRGSELSVSKLLYAFQQKIKGNCPHQPDASSCVHCWAERVGMPSEPRPEAGGSAPQPDKVMSELAAYRDPLILLKNAGSRRFPYPPQVTFSAVCKCWKEATLPQPLLWEFLTSYHHPSMVEVTVQRLKHIPLKVYLDRRGPDFVDLVHRMSLLSNT